MIAGLKLTRGNDAGAQRVPRGKLLSVIRAAIEHARREQLYVAVLMLSLNPNDRLRLYTTDNGEAQLDEALAGLPRLLRSADQYCVVSARQVCIVLPYLATTAQAFLASHKLSRGVGEALADSAGNSWARVLVGIACFPEGADDAESLLMQADAAVAKSEGTQDGICFFSKKPDEAADEQLPRLRNRLLEALRLNSFRLAYQPQLNLASGTCDSAEALLRATLPDGAALPPPLLVAAAEQDGKIGFLTGCILNSALRQLSLWLKSGLDISVSVNLSPLNLRDPDLPDVVARSLESWGVGAERLTLEIVESSMIHSFSEAAAILHRLKQLGVKLAIDDFGTGYSCLAYLRQLPLDELKVDRAFVRNLLQSREDRQLVRATIDLAHNFELRVVAEGVEDEQTLAALQDMRCDLIQGYVVSPALEADYFAQWIDDNKSAIPNMLSEAPDSPT